MELSNSLRTARVVGVVSVVVVLVLLSTNGAESRKHWVFDYFEYSAINCRAHSASLTDFGGVGDGTTSNTKAFQAAIDHLSQFASDGGSQLFVPPGRWLTGSFNLTSHFTLYLHKDAVLLASQDEHEWPVIDPLPSYGRGRDTQGGRYISLIFGTNLTDVVITGENGTIDGQGALWWAKFHKGELKYTRPYLIEIMHSDNVQISSLTLVNSPSWNVHPVYSSNVIIQGLTITAPVTSPNTDGINPDSCTNTRIEDCYIVSGDDCIAVKSGWDEYGIAYGMPTKQLVIRRLTCISPFSATIALGSEMSGGIEDVRAEDILAIDTESGVSSVVAASHSPVKFLPGFEGPLPFELETGYVGVGESEEVQLFYYFVKSENNPTEDPLLLWLTGGPGCSAFSALFYEIGPLYFESVPYHGSLPTLELNPHSWTQVSNIIFLDAPVGTGFSYATTSRASHSDDFQATHQAHEFLRKWLIDHPEFLSNPVYVGGDSYSGITVPLVVQHISNGNEDDTEPFINLKGYLLGNPVTEKGTETTAQFRFAHGMALISDELYESLKTSCGDEYPFKYPINIQCIKDVQAFYKCISGIQIGQILEPVCGFGSLKPEDIFLSGRRYLIGKLRERRPEPSLSAFECRTDGYILAPYWANNATVQEALHIRKNTIRGWQRCAMGLSYTPEIESSFEYHVTLSKKGYRSLIYSGDHDMIVPFFSTQGWIRSLNYSIVDDWRSWMVEGQVGGYTRTYSNQMTFATVKGGGHTAPEYRPKECFSMYKRWVSSQPL